MPDNLQETGKEREETYKETKKREKIIKSLSTHFDTNLFEGILLTGSMAFGKNHCIRRDSDIDLMLIIRPENIRQIMEYEFFRGPYINETGIELFDAGRVDGIFNDYFVDGIMLNLGIWSSGFFERFCGLEADEIRIFKDKIRNNKLKGTRKTASGEVIDMPSKITEYKDNFIVSCKVFEGNELIHWPIFCNLLLSEVLSDKGNKIKAATDTLIGKLKDKYTIPEILELASYGLKKASPEYTERFIGTIYFVSDF